MGNDNNAASFLALLPELQGIIITFLFVLLGVAVIFALRKGWLKNFRAGRDGVQFDARDNETINKQNAHDMSVKINDVDSEMKHRNRKLVTEIRRKLFYGLYLFKTCDLAKAAVSMALYFPLLQAVEENHFRSRLTRASIGRYLDELVKEIGLEYDAFRVMGAAGCDKAGVPAFGEITPMVRELLESQWVSKVIGHMTQASEKKIKTYEDYLRRFRATGDQYSIEVCEARLERNRNYVKELRDV